MTYRVVISDTAQADLRDIFEYIALNLMSPENAVHQIKRLEKAVSGLDFFPETCRDGCPTFQGKHIESECQS